MTDLRTFEQIGPGDADAVGGKGLSLGRLAAAGLPVPAGFCVTTAAYRRLRGRPPETASDFLRQLGEAYERLGGGPVAERQVGMKAGEVTADGEREVPAERQHLPCLDDARLAELAELGRRVEALYGEARDVEWAWAEGRFWLLQARPITAPGAADRK